MIFLTIFSFSFAKTKKVANGQQIGQINPHVSRCCSVHHISVCRSWKGCICTWSCGRSGVSWWEQRERSNSTAELAKTQERQTPRRMSWGKLCRKPLSWSTWDNNTCK